MRTLRENDSENPSTPALVFIIYYCCQSLNQTTLAIIQEELDERPSSSYTAYKYTDNVHLQKLSKYNGHSSQNVLEFTLFLVLLFNVIYAVICVCSVLPRAFLHLCFYARKK